MLLGQHETARLCCSGSTANAAIAAIHREKKRREICASAADDLGYEGRARA